MDLCIWCPFTLTVSRIDWMSKCVWNGWWAGFRFWQLRNIILTLCVCVQRHTCVCVCACVRMQACLALALPGRKYRERKTCNNRFQTIYWYSHIWRGSLPPSISLSLPICMVIVWIGHKIHHWSQLGAVPWILSHSKACHTVKVIYVNCCLCKQTHAGYYLRADSNWTKHTIYSGEQTLSILKFQFLMRPIVVKVIVNEHTQQSCCFGLLDVEPSQSQT